jgi:5-methylcytosine-specific restriction endonuclease McrA
MALGRITSMTALERVRAEQRAKDQARAAVPYRDRWAALVAANLRCAYCAGQGDKFLGPDGRHWHADHRTPWSRGGALGPENVSMVCGRCNSTKGSKTVDELIEWLRTCDETPHRLAMRAVLCG